MTDYCIVCGNAEADKDNGRYVSLTDDEGLELFTETFLCETCEQDRT